MSRGRRPHPDQRTLGQDPLVIAREEDKRQILLVKHHHAVAWCNCQGLTPPTAGQWKSIQEVLTFLRHCEWAMKGNPTAAQIASGCSKRGRKMSERTVQRALSRADDLGVLFSAGQGRGASDRTILYARLREMIVASAPVAPAERVAPTRHLSRQTEPSEAANWRVDDADLAGRTTENGGLILYSDPLPDQPTTTTDGGSSDGGATGDEWSVVVEEVFAAGVNQAEAAVGAARAAGAAPHDVRAIVEHYRRHRDGWQQAAAVLYRRLQRFHAGEPAADGWPAFDDAYQQQLEREHSSERRSRQVTEQLQRRRDMRDERERSAAEWRAGLSLVAIAAELDPALARGIDQARKRMEGTANTLGTTELAKRVSAADGPS